MTNIATVTTFLSGAVTNQTSQIFAMQQERKSIQASIAGTGAVSATVTWYGSNTNATTNGVLLATSTLSGTTSDSTGADMPAEWPYMYCVLSGISGTNAAVTATVGV